MKNLVLEMGQNCFLLEAKNDFSAIKFYTLCREYNDVSIHFFNKLLSNFKFSGGCDEWPFKNFYQMCTE